MDFQLFGGSVIESPSEESSERVSDGVRALIQRVSEAGVRIDGEETRRIGPGLVILLGVTHSDTAEDAGRLAGKCANLRVFEDNGGKMNLSLLDSGGSALVVSQFTLYGDTRRGRRPGFSTAAPPNLAVPLYETFVGHLRNLGVQVQTGTFGAHMHVDIQNDGPVTLMLESPDPS